MSTSTNTTCPSVLHDPSVLTVSLSAAADLLGIAKSTATTQVQATGYLTTGVPVFRVGRRVLVATTHLRSVLGIPDPTVA